MELTENAIRQRLRRQGPLLRKDRSRIRNQARGDGYMIVDGETSMAVGGYLDYCMALDDCQAWVEQVRRR